jgi:hypothetical protein
MHRQLTRPGSSRAGAAAPFLAPVGRLPRQFPGGVLVAGAGAGAQFV